jgi:hypothetical protein
VAAPDPGPSSFLSIAASTTVYPAAGLGPATGAGDATAAMGVPDANGDGDADGDGDVVGVSLPDSLPPRASESESDSVAMRESTSIAASQASPPAAPRVSRAEHGGPHERARAQPRVTAAVGRSLRSASVWARSTAGASEGRAEAGACGAARRR